MMDSTIKTENELYIVGVGTSAGGIDALTKMLNSFNENTQNIAVIIAQHLSPAYKSELASILSRQCRWPVVTVEKAMQVEPQKIYVTPENKRVTYTNKTLQLDELGEKYTYSPSIDDLFASIAENEKSLSIGVVLSGTAQDGSKGIKTIKEYGGFTIAQTPESAQYNDMPLAAIQTGMVDLVRHPSEIFDEISSYIKNHKVIKDIVPTKKGIEIIFELLSKRSGVDFSEYKQSTILRRVDKRIEALRLRDLNEYYHVIKQNPSELDRLFETILIGVTEFFRDREAFSALREKVKSILNEKSDTDSIRVWSVGCATGQEAYSIAILFHEMLGNDIQNFQLQIFASDIDERSLKIARKGVFSATEVESLTPEILSKYFDQVNHEYEVKKTIKQHILFSRHDITNDPPFVKLDLLVCRNLLIYFNNNLQREALRTFNYALKPNGILFLGKSESVSVANDLFSNIEGTKIFRKLQSNTPLNLRFSRYKVKPEEDDIHAVQTKNMSLEDVAKETLYYSSENPFVIISQTGEIKESQGSLRKYMELSQGTMNANIFKMANKELVMEIRTLLAQVKKSSRVHTGTVIQFELYEQENYVRLKILPLIYPSGGSQHYILLFENIDPERSGYLKYVKEFTKKDIENIRIRELEYELESVRDHLQTFTEELESSNEEMQSVNEELQSANEELKSSNEEMETSNEELQSSNEELHTANTELRFVNNQLIEKEAALKESEDKFRIMADNIPTLCWMANEDGWIYWYNLRWYEYTGATPEQMEGWGWQAVHHPKFLPEVMERWQSSIAKGESFEMTFPLKKHDGTFHPFLTRITPLKDAEGKVLQWFGTNTDITEQKNQEQTLDKLVKERTDELAYKNIQLNKSNSDLQQFAHVASHDLTEPVRKIKTFSIMLKDELQDNFPGRSKEFLDKINTSTQRMYYMIGGILDYAKLDSFAVLNDKVDLNEVLKNILADLDLLISESGASIQVDELQTIEGSQLLLYQLFNNLIKNALKFSKKGVAPMIEIKEESIMVSNKEFVKIEIVDNGIGFEQKYASAIFDTFIRLHSQHQYQGTGLGLSICRKIVERHGGVINATSNDGEGATFTIMIPKKQIQL